MRSVSKEALLERPEPEARRRPALAASEPAEALLDAYLADIRHIRVLSPQQEIEFSRRILAGEAALRDVVLALPYTARRLHGRWREILRAGRVTATLAALRRPDGEADRSSEIDGLFEQIGAALARRDRLTAKPGTRPAQPSPTVRRLDHALAGWLHQVDPRRDLLFEVHLELGQRVAALHPSAGRRDGARTPAQRALERESGLAAAELRERLRGLDEALADQAEARDAFVRHNLRLVVSVAKEFRNMGVSFLDLIQEGNLGLLRAVEKFDHRQGCRFSTYGVWWIRQSCIRAIQNTSRTVRLPTNLHDRLLRYRRALASLATDPEAGEGSAAVARALGLTEQEVSTLLEYDRRPLSLEEPVAGSEALTVGDRIEDPGEGAPEALVDDAMLQIQVPALLERLPARERQVLEWRFGLGDAEERTLQDIGEELGLSRERVRQIERGALERLRVEAERRGLEPLVRGTA